MVLIVQQLPGPWDYFVTHWNLGSNIMLTSIGIQWLFRYYSVQLEMLDIHDMLHHLYKGMEQMVEMTEYILVCDIFYYCF